MKKRFVFLLLLNLSFIGCKGHDENNPITKSQLHSDRFRWEIFSFIPEESQMVMYVNLKDIRNTESWDTFFKPYFNQSDAKFRLHEFKKATGFRIEANASELISSITEDGNSLVAVSFNKNIKNVHKYFGDENKFSISRIKGKKVYQIKNRVNEKFIFSNDSTLIMFSDTDYLEEVLNNENESLKSNKEFIGLIERIKNKNKFWLAVNDGKATFSIIRKIIGDFKDVPGKKLIRSIKKLTISADFENGMNVESNLICNSRKNSYLLSAGISSAVAMDIISNKNFILGKVTKNLHVSTDNNEVQLKVKLNENEIKELNNLVKNNYQNKNSKQL